jgi:hypothetical protein
MQVLDIGFKLAAGLLQGAGTCDATNVAPVALLHGLLGFAGKWLGSATDKPEYRTARWMDYLCPDLIPSQSEVDMLYATTRISIDQWTCWTRANNNQPETREQIIAAMDVRPSPMEVVQLRNRGYYSDEDALKILNQQGVTSGWALGGYRELARFVPGPSDLVTFMVRDVFDPIVVQNYNLDYEFADKFQGQALAWAKSQGMDADTFKYYWRSHWKLPSSEQAFEMYHRLRPETYGPDVGFTRDDLSKMLAINDVAPAFIDRYIEISRPLMRLVDMRNSYNVGVVNRDQVVSYIQDRGMDIDDANTVAKYWTIKRWDFLKGRKWYKNWVTGSITDAMGAASAVAEGCTAEDVQYLASQANEERHQNVSKVCTNAVHKRYLIGDVSAAQSVAALQTLGHDIASAITIQTGWACELSSRGKVIGASELCQYVEQGLITIPEYTTRLRALGYSELDASRVAAICGGKIQTKLNALQAKLDATAARVASANAKAVAQAKRAADVAAGKAQKELDAFKAKKIRLADKVAATKKKLQQSAERDSQKVWADLAAAADVVAQYAEEDISGVLDHLEGTFGQLVDGHGMSFVGAANLIKVWAKNIKDQKSEDWKHDVDQWASDLAHVPDPDWIKGDGMIE